MNFRHLLSCDTIAFVWKEMLHLKFKIMLKLFFPSLPDVYIQTAG